MRSTTAGMDRNDLYVAECFADGGTMLKRMQPVSKGRGHAILKRTSHITVILDVKKAEGESNMGQKVNPHGLRVGVIKGWDTQWYADKKEFSAYSQRGPLHPYLPEEEVLRGGGLASILIERAAGKIVVTVYTGRPGVLIGKAGSEIEVIKKDLVKLTKGKQVSINVTEVRKPDADAQLVAESVAAQLEKRFRFRRAMKQAIGRTMRAGVKGVKMQVSGRLDGREIAGCEHYHEGSIPLQTLRADIDYGFAEAHTTFGMIGVKCWIYKGEVLKAAKKAEGGRVMLIPKRVKRRKQHRPNMKGSAQKGNSSRTASTGSSRKSSGWIKSNQIEAARIAMTRFIKRGGKVWIDIFPHKPITRHPAEARMGSGKGGGRILGRGRQAGQSDVRNGGRERGRGTRGNAPCGAQAARQVQVRQESGAAEKTAEGGEV